MAWYLGPALVTASELNPRVQRAARAVLLKLGQWLLESRESTRDGAVQAHEWKFKGETFVAALLSGLSDLVDRCEAAGVPKGEIVQRRRVFLSSAEHAGGLVKDWSPVSLVLTSPPYPGVHVLYHRWQVEGRRETPAPYWLTNTLDGSGPSYYTLGGRHSAGIDRYFLRLEAIFRGLASELAGHGRIVQVVAFRDRDELLPRYETAMRRAGLISLQRRRPERPVPGRRWYARGRKTDGGRELLLIHGRREVSR